MAGKKLNFMTIMAGSRNIPPEEEMNRKIADAEEDGWQLCPNSLKVFVRPSTEVWSEECSGSCVPGSAKHIYYVATAVLVKVRAPRKDI